MSGTSGNGSEAWRWIMGIIVGLLASACGYLLVEQKGLHSRVAALENEKFGVQARLNRIEDKLDRLLERGGSGQTH